MPESVIGSIAIAAVQNRDVESSRNGPVRRGYHSFSVGRLEESVCASKALSAYERRVGGIRQEDSAGCCAAEMDAVAARPHTHKA
jgi:hypothetical protein